MRLDRVRLVGIGLLACMLQPQHVSRLDTVVSVEQCVAQWQTCLSEKGWHGVGQAQGCAAPQQISGTLSRQQVDGTQPSPQPQLHPLQSTPQTVGLQLQRLQLTQPELQRSQSAQLQLQRLRSTWQLQSTQQPQPLAQLELCGILPLALPELQAPGSDLIGGKAWRGRLRRRERETEQVGAAIVQARANKPNHEGDSAPEGGDGSARRTRIKYQHSAAKNYPDQSAYGEGLSVVYVQPVLGCSSVSLIDRIAASLHRHEIGLPVSHLRNDRLDCRQAVR